MCLSTANNVTKPSIPPAPSTCRAAVSLYSSWQVIFLFSCFFCLGCFLYNHHTHPSCFPSHPMPHSFILAKSYWITNTHIRYHPLISSSDPHSAWSLSSKGLQTEVVGSLGTQCYSLSEHHHVFWTLAPVSIIFFHSIIFTRASTWLCIYSVCYSGWEFTTCLLNWVVSLTKLQGIINSHSL